MAQKNKTKTLYVDLNVKKGIFASKFFSKRNLNDFSDIELLRKLMSNEKARILHTIKTKKPKSIYNLAKILKRDLKSVREDVKMLERFGFIDFYSSKTGKRSSLQPYLSTNKLNIFVNI
jgi:predicted transcriptional regulator